MRDLHPDPAHGIETAGTVPRLISVKKPKMAQNITSRNIRN